MSTCPLGHAWHDEALSDNNAHRMAQCSNRGKCIEKTQECECQPGFGGAACERLDCPSVFDEEEKVYHECNGRGGEWRVGKRGGERSVRCAGTSNA